MHHYMTPENKFMKIGTKGENLMQGFIMINYSFGI